MRHRIPLLASLVLAWGCAAPQETDAPPEIRRPPPPPVDAVRRPVARPPLVTPLPGGTDRAEKDAHVFHFDSFEDVDLASRYGEIERAANVRVADDQVFMGARSLRVDFPAQGNYGCAFHYKFAARGRPEPEELYARFYLRFGEDFAPGAGGKLAGPAGTYGRAGWGGRPSDGTNGWSARIGFLPDADPHRVLLRFYTYHARSGTWGDNAPWSLSRRGSLERGRWYCVECYVKLNTPGKEDGILRGWVDGELACERTKIVFRLTDELKIEEFWVAYYFGGADPTPKPIHLHMDNLVLSPAPIGEARER